MNYDVAVIGGGPGGYVAAIKARQLGKSVCLIEKNKIGGTCLNVGCIPTKYLLTNSNKYAELFEYHKLGIQIERVDLDYKKMISGKEALVKKLTDGVKFLLRKNKVDVISGTASFIDKETLNVDTGSGVEKVSASNILIATGSMPILPELFGYDGEIVCSSKEALEWEKAPDSILIVGGGVVGCELATIYSNLGTEVTIVEMQDKLIPNMDSELGKFARNKLEQKGVNIFTEVKVDNIAKGSDTAIVEMSNGTKIEVAKVVVSIGRKANLESLNCEVAGIAIKNGKITVNNKMKTSTPGIYAIGDACCSLYDLAHSAMKEGIIAIENIIGNDEEMKYDAIPSCVYTSPEIASVGLTEQQASSIGIEITKGRFSFVANGKAVSMGEAEGFVKIIADKKTDVILGAQMAGPHVTDLIAQMVIAVDNRLVATEIADPVYAHPTLSEAIWEAAESIYGSAIHS